MRKSIKLAQLKLFFKWNKVKDFNTILKMGSMSGIYCKKGSNYHFPLSFFMLQHQWKNPRPLLGLLANKWIARRMFSVVNKSSQHSALSISRKSWSLPPLNTYCFGKDRRNCLHCLFFCLLETSKLTNRCELSVPLCYSSSEISINPQESRGWWVPADSSSGRQWH